MLGDTVKVSNPRCGVTKVVFQRSSSEDWLLEKSLNNVHDTEHLRSSKAVAFLPW